MSELLTAWDEPVGGTPRGTVVVLPGRGEGAAAYQRLGRRLSADAYKVRYVDADPADVAATRVRIEKALAEEGLPAPVVLLGADTGAALATLVAGEVGADGVVLAGLALAGSTVAATAGSDGWEAEVEARSACPVHRGVMEGPGFTRGALADEVTVEPVAPGVPTLLVHGASDPVTEPERALAALGGAAVEAWLVEGGRHDVLNDLAHRSVAATVVLFLERLRAGADLAPIMTRA